MNPEPAQCFRESEFGRGAPCPLLHWVSFCNMAWHKKHCAAVCRAGWVLPANCLWCLWLDSEKMDQVLTRNIWMPRYLWSRRSHDLLGEGFSNTLKFAGYVVLFVLLPALCVKRSISHYSWPTVGDSWQDVYGSSLLHAESMEGPYRTCGTM